jgi:hypothetical protein
MRSRGAACAMLLAVAWGAAAEAEDWLRWEHRGHVLEEGTYAAERASPLDPGGDFLGLAALQNRLFLDLDAKLGLGSRVSLVARDRAIYLLDESGRRELRNAVEDAYLSVRPSQGSLLELGKRNVREGVGYAFNPVDMLSTVSRLNGADRDPAALKENRPGNVLARGQAQLGGLTLSAVFSPRVARLRKDGINTQQQILAKAYVLVHGHDVSLYAYNGSRWKAGLAWDTVLGRGLELHAEGTLQRGSDVPVLGETQGVAAFIERPDERLMLRAMAGVNVTAGNGLNVIAEYCYDGTGYTRSEFARFFEHVGAAASRWPEPSSSAQLVESLGVLGSVQGRHLAFLRVSGLRLPGGLQIEAFDVVNVVDRSQLISGRLARSIGNFRMALAVDAFTGSPRSQFGVLPMSGDVRLQVHYFY